MKNMYESPLCSRYSSDEMKYVFSDDKKFKTWRRLWIALAEAEQELGLNISDEQLNELKSNSENINYQEAAEQEKKVRHDVMAHIHAYGLQCQKAAGIIHLGATSCYVGDNTDIIIMNEGLNIIKVKILSVIAKLYKFADEYKDLPCLGFTHFQPAQLTTVGKRATLWIHDLLTDLEDVNYLLDSLKLLGSKGTTGTQASFMELFDGDYEKVKELDRLIAKKMDHDKVYPVSGQTYSRKIDARVLNVLSGVALSCAKFAGDIRLLQHLKEIEEPFEAGQIGSSAMAYKRNPMRCERMAGLCRYVIADAQNAAMTASSQWLERSLDDSANKRIAVPEAFLAVDAILNIYLNVSSGLVVYPKMIEKHIMEELPFMATENILMAAVKKGGDRQMLHEKIRRHSMDAGHQVKVCGGDNDLIDRIASDTAFQMSVEEISASLAPKNYIGFAARQTEDFLAEYVKAILEENSDKMIEEAELSI